MSDDMPLAMYTQPYWYFSCCDKSYPVYSLIPVDDDMFTRYHCPHCEIEEYENFRYL